MSTIGSLATGKPDEFSDIDVQVDLKSGVEDRAFFFDVPGLMAGVGSAVSGWGFITLPDLYVATFLFDDAPLFWAVDIACVSDTHTDGSDLISVYRWEQIYKMWLAAAKGHARASAKLADVRALVVRHTPVEDVASTSAAELRAVLDGIRQRKIDRGDPYEELHARCEDLLQQLAQGGIG